MPQDATTLAPLGRRPAEARLVLVAGAFFFCVLAALSMLRPAREALGMARGLDSVRWLFALTVLVTLLVNPVFGWLVSRFRRITFVITTYAAIALGLLAFYALLVLAPSQIGERSGQVFYVWFSVSNLFATMLFWALVSDRFSLEESKRFYGPIGIGGTLGAICGPLLAGQLAPWLGTAALLPVAALFLGGAIGLAILLVRLPAAAPREADASAHGERAPSSVGGPIGGSAWEGLRAVFRSRYLLGISAYVLLVTIMATFVYFTRLGMVAAEGDALDARTALFAHIDTATQVATLVLQALLAGPLMRRLGTAITLAVLPVVAALGFTGLALFGGIGTLIVFEALFRAVQRGLMRPARETLFTVVTREERYKAKAFVDTMVYRLGDLVGSQLEGLLGLLGLGLLGLASLAVPLGVAWAALALWLGRTQRARSIAQDEGVRR